MLKTITRTECPESLRMEFLPNAVGNQFFRYEQLTFAFMDKACPAYDGGYWNFYSLSNGGFYMALNIDNRLKLQWPDNYFEDEMSADAAGIGVSLMAQNTLACKAPSQRIIEQYYALRDYAAQHEEAAMIYRFID